MAEGMPHPLSGAEEASQVTKEASPPRPNAKRSMTTPQLPRGGIKGCLATPKPPPSVTGSQAAPQLSPCMKGHQVSQQPLEQPLPSVNGYQVS